MDLVINSKGLRDREYTYEKPPGTRRILCLGDSYTLGYGVSVEEAYPNVLERILNERRLLGCRWQVINAGVANTGTAHQLAYFEAEGRKYQPDLVLCCLCSANDFADNVASHLYEYRDQTLTKRDSYPTGPLRLQYMVQRIPGYQILFRRSHLATFVKYRVAEYMSQRNRAARARRPERTAAAEERADELARRLILALRDACARENTEFLLTVVPEYESCAISDRAVPLVRYTEARGVAFLDLSVRFRDRAAAGIQDFFPVDHHWNRSGHRLAAEIIYDDLAQRANADAPRARSVH